VGGRGRTKDDSTKGEKTQSFPCTIRCETARFRLHRYEHTCGFSIWPYYIQFSNGSGSGIGDRIINHGLWPRHLSDLTPCNFYLWGNFKNNVYRMNLNTKEEIKKIYKEKLWTFPRKNFSRQILTYLNSIKSVCACTET
jgi:hypothetical protein